MNIITYPYTKFFTKQSKKIDSPKDFDVLVEIKAISVNPIDTKVKHNINEEESRVLGWDASGIILNKGEKVKDFNIGDEVYYAGALNRDGTNASHHVVDSRLIALKPKSLEFKESAALPLTSLTAYEGLFDRMNISLDPENNKGKSILIINGAGGVGSIATQLAKYVGLNVIATASRQETENWSYKMGADKVVNHYEDYIIDLVDYIYCLHTPDVHMKKMSELIKPFGKICAIVDSKEPLNMNLLKPKSVSFSWEFMFTHSNFEVNIEHQADILEHIAKLIDENKIKSTINKVLSPINEESLSEAHKIIESNSSIGKIVIENI